MTDTNDRLSGRTAGSYTSLAPRALVVCLAFVSSLAAQANQGGLTELSLEQLLEVKIVGASKYEQKQTEVAASASVITRGEIKAFGWRTLDEALASLPGVYSTYDRQYSYFGTRGFSLLGDLNTRLLVTINGNRVNDPIFDTGPFGRQLPLDIALIERIEFIPGPGGAVYGQNAMFGVVNLVTRSGAEIDGTELSFAYQQPQAMREGRVSWGNKFDNGTDVLISASGMRSHGEDRFMEYGATGMTGVAAGLDAERDGEFFGRIAHGPWQFEHLHGDRRKDDPTGVYGSDPLVPGSYQADRYALTQLQYQDSFAGDTLQVSGRVFRGSEHYEAVLTHQNTRKSFPSDSQWYGAEMRVLSTALANHKLMAGLELQDNARQDQAVYGNTDPADDVLIAREGYRLGVFAQDEWLVASSLTATLGLRGDRNNIERTKFSPRAALIWRATGQTTLKVLYGRAHRSPNVYERDYDDGGITKVANLNLKGETIDTVEFSADQRLGSDLSVHGSIYQWNIRDLITTGTDPASGFPQYQTGGDAKARGVELSLDKIWRAGARARSSLSLQDVAYNSATKLPNSPKLLAKLNVSAPLPVARLRAGYELRYDSARLSANGTDLGGYTLSNLYLSTDSLAKGLEISLGIYNLFDKHYLHPAGPDTNHQNAFEQDGRSLRLTMNFSF
jgi:outer membrane receptor protein involved in Fe transport